MDRQPYFDIVAREIATEQLDPGTWARAFSDCDGDQARAKARYIKLRVDRLIAIDREKRRANNPNSAGNDSAALEAIPTIIIIFLVLGALLIVSVIATIGSPK